MAYHEESVVFLPLPAIHLSNQANSTVSSPFSLSFPITFFFCIPPLFSDLPLNLSMSRGSTKFSIFEMRVFYHFNQWLMPKRAAKFATKPSLEIRYLDFGNTSPIQTLVIFNAICSSSVATCNSYTDFFCEVTLSCTRHESAGNSLEIPNHGNRL